MEIVQHPDGQTCEVTFFHPTGEKGRYARRVLTKQEALYLKGWVDGAVDYALRGILEYN